MRFLSASLLTITSSACSRSANIIASIIAARLLSSIDYGTFVYVVSTATTIATIASLGGGVICNKTASSSTVDRHDYVFTLFLIVLLLNVAVAFSLSLFFLITIMEPLSSVSQTATCGVLISLAILSSVSSSSEGMLYGLRKIPELFKISLLALVFALASTYLLTSLLGVIGALVGVSIHRLILATLTTSKALKHRKDAFGSLASVANVKDALRTLRSASPPLTSAALFAGPVVTLSIYLLERNEGLTAVANFGFIYQFFLLATFVPTALGHYILSKSAGVKDGSETVLKKALLATGAWGLLACGLLSLLPAISSAISSDINVSRTSALGFGIAAFLFSLSSTFNAYWPALKKEGTILSAQITWALCLIIVITAGVDTYGGEALALAFPLAYAAHLAVNLIAYFGVRQHA